MYIFGKYCFKVYFSWFLAILFCNVYAQNKEDLSKENLVKDKHLKTDNGLKGQKWQFKVQRYIKNKEYDKAVEFLETRLLSNEKNNPEKKYYPEAIVLFELYYSQSKNNISLKNSVKAKKLQDKLHTFARFGENYLYLAYIYASQAKVFQQLNDITESNRICHIGLKELESHKTHSGTAKVKMRILWILAQNYYRTNNLSKAVDTGEKAFSILEKAENTSSLRKSAENLLQKWRSELNAQRK